MVLHYNAGRQCAGLYILLRYHLLFWIGRVGVGVVGRWRLRGLGGCWLLAASFNVARLDRELEIKAEEAMVETN
jgi:hypothetical protein